MNEEIDLPLLRWRPPPVVVPFPVVRNRRRIAARLANAARFRRDTAERQILRDIETYREVLERRGIAPAKIESEVTAYRTALFIGLEGFDWSEESA